MVLDVADIDIALDFGEPLPLSHLRPSEQIRLTRLSNAHPRELSRDDLYELRALASKAVGPPKRERPGLTLDVRITLRGLRQSCDAEDSRRHGGVRNGGRDWRPPSPGPQDRETTVFVLRMLARSFDKEAESLSNVLGEPPRHRLPSARRIPAARPRRRTAGLRLRRVRRRTTRAKAPPSSDLDPDLAKPGAAGCLGAEVAA